jgi:hypothetical protein
MSEEKAIESLGNKIDGLKKDIADQNTVAAVMTTQLSTAADDRKAIRKDVKEIRTWILGNGNPEGGLAGKVKGLENWRSSIGKWSKWILGIVATLIASSVAILAFG